MVEVAVDTVGAAVAVAKVEAEASATAAIRDDS
jgi:hypothetical protein